MSARVHCPGCRIKFKVPAPEVGQKHRCSKCETVFLLAKQIHPETGEKEWQALEVFDDDPPSSPPTPAGHTEPPSPPGHSRAKSGTQEEGRGQTSALPPANPKPRPPSVRPASMTPKDKATAPDDEAIDDFDVVEEEPAEVGTLTRSQETSGASRSSRRKSDQRPDSRKPGRKTPVINAADIGRWRVVLISVTIEMIGVVLQVIATALLIGMALLTAFNLGNPGRRAELPVFVVLAAVGAVRVVSRALLIAAPTRNNASTWAAAALLAGLAALAMDLLSIGSPIARYFGSQTLGVVAWILQMVCLKAIAESLRAREAAESFRENAFYLAAILTIEIFSVVALITLMFVKSSRSAGGSPLSTAFGCLGTALRITWISLILRVVVTYLLALHRLREKLRGRLAAAVADKEKEAEGQDDA